MRFSTAIDLGLGALLGILFILVFLAYQYSTESTALLETVIREHAPARNRLLQVNDLLHDANQAYTRYILQDRITAEDVLITLDHLWRQRSALDARLLALGLPSESPGSIVKIAQQMFADYLQTETPDEIGDPLLRARLETALSRIRQDLQRLAAQAQAHGRTGDIAALLESCANLLDLVETEFQRYAERSRLKLLDILNPLNQSLKLLHDLQTIGYGSDSPEGDEGLPLLIGALKRYKGAMVLYQDETDLDVGGANLETIKKVVSQAKEAAGLALRALNQIISQRIQDAQTGIIVAGERRQQTFFGLACLAVVLAVMVSYLLSRTLSRRIQDLVQGAQRFAQGDLDYRLKVGTDDQLGELALVFNQMAEALKKKEIERENYLKEIARVNSRLETRVQQRTEELSAANAQLARAMRSRDEFLATMSHELRTPLTAILGMSEALMGQGHGSLNERQERYLGYIEESGQHLLALINDILDVVQIESGKLELTMAPVSIEALCAASLRLIGKAAGQKELTVNCAIDPQIDQVPADERRLKQVLVNLLSNAVKFTPKGGTVGLEVNGDAAAGVVRFSVWDTGIGINEDDFERLFKPFVQLDSRLSRQYGGSGLGLALVQRITELHGGSVTVDSSLGRGSRFTVALPWQPPVSDRV